MVPDLHTTASPSRIKTSVLAVGVHSDGTLSEAAAQVDRASDGAIRGLLAQEPGIGRAGSLEVLRGLPGVAAGRVAVIGLGESGSSCDVGSFESACRAFARYCGEASVGSGVSTLVSVAVGGMAAEDRARLATSVAVQSAYSYAALAPYGRTREAEAPVWPLPGLWMPRSQAGAVKAGMREGAAMGNGINLARLLADLPANVCTPAYLGGVARQLAREFSSLQARVLTRPQIEKLGMGAFLAVSRGSDEPPAFIILRHVPEACAAGDAPVVLVGKGVTFDSGGLSLKTAAGMEEMKYDMGGAACVLGTMRAIAELGLPREVIALVPACENMPGSGSLKPGDVVTSMSGRTIEVLNTDAEGRLILCDALTYAARFKPAAVIDVATLTGACVVALGAVHSGLFANDEALAGQLLQAGRQVRDTAWQLPLDEAYQEALHSPFADMSNTGGQAAGAAAAAWFLSRFASGHAWAHLDVAGTARRRGKDRQATGRPVSLLVRYLASLC